MIQSNPMIRREFQLEDILYIAIYIKFAAACSFSFSEIDMVGEKVHTLVKWTKIFFYGNTIEQRCSKGKLSRMKRDVSYLER